jgi:DNA-binding NarL/FixJ family response regulator
MERILIADDHPLIQKGLSYLLRYHLPHSSLQAAYNGKQVFKALKKQVFDLLILDVNMPFMTFIDFEQIIQSYPTLKVLILTQYSDENLAIRYIKKGAYGFLNKSATDEELIVVIKSILNGHKYLGPSVMDQLVNNIKGNSAENPLEQLSSREYEVVLLLSKGLSLTEIAFNMHISLSAVSTYKNRTMQKLNVKSLVGLVELCKEYLK